MSITDQFAQDIRLKYIQEVRINSAKDEKLYVESSLQNSPSSLILDHPMVRRSMSLKVAAPDKIEIPPELRDTIYDVTTPKSEKVRRHLSDRMVVSSGGSGKDRARPRPRIKPSAMATTTPGATAVGRRTFVMIGNQQPKNSIPVRVPPKTHNAY